MSISTRNKPLCASHTAIVIGKIGLAARWESFWFDSRGVNHSVGGQVFNTDVQC